ncbi:hypothetical protein WA026_003641 [Henosepilachna vigintioctopunctata]|uniref:Uncharacterized protein n=1 Tax=Henosepilachna vigintioctopunctata TaxID=420089 RepID=A0AAW1UCD7_9CUCU
MKKHDTAKENKNQHKYFVYSFGGFLSINIAALTAKLPADNCRADQVGRSTVRTNITRIDLMKIAPPSTPIRGPGVERKGSGARITPRSGRSGASREIMQLLQFRLL